MPRFMCDHGYHVLRFDCRGCGDSEGGSEQVTLKTQLSDIGRAMEVLADLTGVTNPVLFGLRFGATRAGLTAEAHPEAKALVLWEPIVQVKAYLLQYLRMQVVAEKLRDGKVTKTRNDFLGDLKEGRPVDILGFMLGPELFNECVELALLAQGKRFSQPLLVFAMSRSESYRHDLHRFMESYPNMGKDLELVQLEERHFWLDPNNVFRELASWHGHEELFRLTFGWLEDRR